MVDQGKRIPEWKWVRGASNGLLGKIGVAGVFFAPLWKLVKLVWSVLATWQSFEFLRQKTNGITSAKFAEWLRWGAGMIGDFLSSGWTQMLITATGVAIVLFVGFRESRKEGTIASRPPPQRSLRNWWGGQMRAAEPPCLVVERTGVLNTSQRSESTAPVNIDKSLPRGLGANRKQRASQLAQDIHQWADGLDRLSASSVDASGVAAVFYSMFASRLEEFRSVPMFGITVTLAPRDTKSARELADRLDLYARSWQ